MSYATSDYRGDDLHCIPATGDVVVGDAICFERATFTGGFRNARFAGFERITGQVVKDSYGREKQQHTFTIELEGGTTLQIKGRNLYSEAVYRKPWANESARHAVADEKHARGNQARAVRAARTAEQSFRM